MLLLFSKEISLYIARKTSPFLFIKQFLLRYSKDRSGPSTAINLYSSVSQTFFTIHLLKIIIKIKATKTTNHYWLTIFGS